MCDLFGGEAAHLAKRQRQLCVRRQCRVAACENQPQTIVFNRVVVPRLGIVGGRFDPGRQLTESGVETGTPPHPVDRLEAAC